MGNPVVSFDIGCRDREKTGGFYKDLFDWQLLEQPFNVGVKTNGGKGIDGAVTALGHEPHNYVMVYTEVSDIAQSLSRVAQLGGSTVIPETEVPGQGAFAWFKDPEGNLMGLWKPA